MSVTALVSHLLMSSLKFWLAPLQPSCAYWVPTLPQNRWFMSVTFATFQVLIWPYTEIAAHWYAPHAYTASLSSALELNT